MRKLLKDLQAGLFVPRWNYRIYGYAHTKSLDNALYKLRKKGFDIKMLKEYGETVYYLKNS
jgi:hypothetical protein